MNRYEKLKPYLLGSAVAVGVGIVILAYMVVFQPWVAQAKTAKAEKPAIVLPNYDVSAWHTLPVQHQGRLKPFETACMEEVRSITGRSRFEKHDAVAIVLSWMFRSEPVHEFFLPTANAPAALTAVIMQARHQVAMDWEHYPFILCDHHGLRRIIYQHRFPNAEVPDELAIGKHISPADLRRSPGFERLLKEATETRKLDPQKAHFHMSTEHLKAEKVRDRLLAYDHICGRHSSRLLNNAIISGTFVDLEDKADLAAGDNNNVSRQQLLDEELVKMEQRLRKIPDPFHLVGLDRVPNSAWFSIGELRVAMRAFLRHQDKWREYMTERLAELPQLYVRPEYLQGLRDFQAQIKAGKGMQAVDELAEIMKQNSEFLVESFARAIRDQDQNQLQFYKEQIVRSDEDQRRFAKAFSHSRQQQSINWQPVIDELRAIRRERDEKVLERMRHVIGATKTIPYLPEDPRFRMLHLDFLENRYPNVYEESLAAQTFPEADVREVLSAYQQVRWAYQTGRSQLFDEAATTFFRTLRRITDRTTIIGAHERLDMNSAEGQLADAAFKKVEEAWQSGDSDKIASAEAAFFQAVHAAGLEAAPYPGDTGALALELTFNRVQPFMWAWIIMLGAVMLFLVNMVVKSRGCYIGALSLYGLSLLFQTYGFYCRVAISGRPPVTNMYETVIFVACMSAVFALILELVYRKGVIGFAGAIGATLCLVLAWLMPVALDPKISPLVPVLRSTYWLTVHVLTIVASYAGGTLAWILGNITLALIVFGKGKPDTIKMLSHYTYRAMQIAVLLLAAGTFLGGWWAAESWGRFWGWDAKEVGALVALVCYVIPLHARYVGWVKDFGLAVSAILCYAAIIMSWYVINFVIAAGLHSYGFGGGGAWDMLLASLINVEWVIIASMIYLRKQHVPVSQPAEEQLVSAQA